MNATGRNEGYVERFVQLTRSLLHSPQFSILSTAARSLVFEMTSMFNGTNNGHIFLSVRDASARLGFSDYKAAASAFAELQQFGWLTETMAGSFAMKGGQGSRARAWRLNWIRKDGKSIGSGVLPDIDFSTITKTQHRRLQARSKTLSTYLKERQRGKFAVEDSTTQTVREAAADASRVEENTTLARENGSFPSIGIVGESTTHIVPSATPPVSDKDQAEARRAKARKAVKAVADDTPRTEAA